MTETNSLGNATQDQGAANSDSAATSSVNVASQQPAEKMLRQSEVTAIAGRAKQEGYEKAQREHAEKNNANVQATHANPQASPQQGQYANTVGGMPQLTTEQVQQLIAQHAPQAVAQHVQQQQWQAMETQYISRLEAEKKEFPDFDEKVKILDLGGKNRDLIPILSSAKLAAPTIYEIAENPILLSDLRRLAMEINPQAAFNAINKMSDSIEKNRAALNQKNPREPLSQIKTSVTGADNSPLTVAERKKQAMYRA